MVSSSRTPAGSDRVRALNLPQPVAVTLDPHSGKPAQICARGRCHEVERVQDIWQVDEEWWREPISRRYLQVLLQGGALRVIFQDRRTNSWFQQAY